MTAEKAFGKIKALQEEYRTKPRNQLYTKRALYCSIVIVQRSIDAVALIHLRIYDARNAHLAAPLRYRMTRHR